MECIECLVQKFSPRVRTAQLAFNPVSIQNITKLCTLKTYVCWGGGVVVVAARLLVTYITMDGVTNPMGSVAWTTWLVLMLLKVQQGLEIPLMVATEEDDQDELSAIVHRLQDSEPDASSMLRATLHNYRFCTAFMFLEEDLGFWVKPRSTTWFSRFLLEQYDNTLWISMFRMTKASVFALAGLLKPHVEKSDTNYRVAVPVLVRVACTLFKLSHGANLTICSEMFAIGTSTVSKVLREVVHAINDTMRHELLWPTGDRLREKQQNFAALCGLPGEVGAIDGMHVAISKPQHVPTDYFYFKSGGYSLNCQAVVDSDKRFLDLYLGMPGSTNDARMLRRSSLFSKAMDGTLMDNAALVDGFTPSIIGDLGYPLLPWLMVPHRTHGPLTAAETLFNKKLRRGRCVVENAFGILKQTFRELLEKSYLSVAFLPDVILSCAILHNVLLGQSHEEVEELLQILHIEGLDGEVVDDGEVHHDGPDANADNQASIVATDKRTELGVYLTMQRRHQA